MLPIPDMDEEKWHKAMAVNFNSGFYAAKYQIPATRRRGGGSIVFTSSFVGHRSAYLAWGRSRRSFSFMALIRVFLDP
ncbi:SDR family oxidoreductase [Cognatiyoonia sp. IB215446]|uniref:SDR family NAD(P)-dependent oxidoreductase n=1 Tax=Cognatiyoonia sp. IB215446 TaxID=3097355 RepID=UPI002A0EF644|nr:SDR family NAD(P)-dependent oxidoreductase [Cognatiyoonia sp. IB215446]MDX8350522.1 SDR family oxidoreductase [Cognatiyoonia sp. IB215446]